MDEELTPSENAPPSDAGAEPAPPPTPEPVILPERPEPETLPLEEGRKGYDVRPVYDLSPDEDPGMGGVPLEPPAQEAPPAPPSPPPSSDDS